MINHRIWGYGTLISRFGRQQPQFRLQFLGLYPVFRSTKNPACLLDWCLVSNGSPGMIITRHGKKGISVISVAAQPIKIHFLKTPVETNVIGCDICFRWFGFSHSERNHLLQTWRWILLKYKPPPNEETFCNLLQHGHVWNGWFTPKFPSYAIWCHLWSCYSR